MRAFVAIPLSDEVLASLGEARRALSRTIPHGSVRWVRPEGIHLTLKFLGDTPVGRLPAVESALAAVARNSPAFTISIGGVGCFPNTRRPRVVWIGTSEPQGRLVRLHAGVEEALDRAGFAPEGRPFKPHLTLGRVNRRASRSEAAHLGELVASALIGDLAQMHATHVDLIRSVLKPTGAEYTTLAAFALRHA